MYRSLSTLCPAPTRSESTSRSVLGDLFRDSEQFTGDSKDTYSVQGNLLRDLPEWLEDFTENLGDEGVSASRETPASTAQIRNVLRKWHQRSTVFLLTSRKTTIAKYAREPRSQGLLAGRALAQQYLEQKILVT